MSRCTWSDGYDTSTSTSWENKWIDNIFAKVDGVADTTAPFRWMYRIASGPEFDPGSNAGLYARQNCQLYDSLCSPPIARFGFLEDSAAVDSVSFEIIQVLDSLADIGTIEANLEYVELVYEVFYLEGITPDSSIIYTLTEIAEMHPYYGGKGVYYARAMLKTNFQDQLFWFRAGRDFSSTRKEINTEYSVYPNPASDFATIASKIPFSSGSRLIICDVFGKVCRIVTLNSNSTLHQFSTSELITGIFHCVVEKEGKVAAIIKLAIIRQ